MIRRFAGVASAMYLAIALGVFAQVYVNEWQWWAIMSPTVILASLYGGY